MREKIVYFDVDGTIVPSDGHDFLASFRDSNVQDQMKEIVRRTMVGEISFEDSIRQKIELIQPSQKDMALLAQHYIDNVSEETLEVMRALRKAGVQIGILSGNFLQAIVPLAKMLGADFKNIHANSASFTTKGQYNGYDPESPLMTYNGKAELIQKLGRNFRRVTMVGDGPIDLNTKPFVHKFIGFGGINEHPSVRDGSDIFIASPTLTPVLLEVLPAWRKFMLRKDPLMQTAKAATVIRR